MTALISSRTAALTLVAALSMGLAACGNKDDKTPGQKLDTAIAQTENAAANAKAEVKDAAADAKVAADRATAEAQVAAAQAGAKVENAADRAADKVSHATSKVAATAEDAAITASVSAGLLKDPDLSAIKIDVDTRGNEVTLHGSAPTAAAKERATTIAKSVKGVKSVQNMLTVK